MFHVNPATGETGQCRAHQGNCPFGSAEEHFSTREAAEAHYGRAMADQVLKTHRREPVESPVKLYPLVEELALKEALEQGTGIAEAKANWERASIEYAATPEGLAYFQQLEAGSELGSPGQAIYQHFISEGNRLRVNRMTPDDLASALFSANPSAAAEVKGSPLPEAPVRWDSYAARDDRGGVRVGTSYVSDLQDYERKVDEFLADVEGADEATLQRLHPAYRAFTDLTYTSNAPKEFEGDYRRWRDKVEALEAHTYEVAKLALAHPKASAADFKVAIEEFGAEKVIPLPSCPKEVKEAYIAEKKGKVGEELLPQYREERYGSNRMAIYMAAADPDDAHRLEAFHQVVVMPMETVTEKDRLWMARNLDKFPTSEGTVDTLKHSLRLWAQSYADVGEREKLLEALGDRLPEVPEDYKPKRGFLRRKS